jgi:outer membrane receptor protein involved in Fe transport
MNLNKRFTLLIAGLCCCSASFAQIDVAILMMKTQLPGPNYLQTWQNISAVGFGTFLNFGFALPQHDEITVEAGFHYFNYDDSPIYSAPCLISYRYLLNREDSYGFYVEPGAGYAFGSTDIQESQPGGQALYTASGSPVIQKVTGPATALTVGYLFQPSGWIRFNIGLRYDHTFVNGDPATNVISLRISHAFLFGRRD